MNEPQREEITDARKAMYYGGMAVSAIGLLIFLSLFVVFPSAGDGNFGAFDSGMRSFAGRGILGMVLMILGQAVRTVGSRGLAGSGVILDPARARKDVEPWSRMAGGVVNDALSEVDVVKSVGQPGPSEGVVKVRCPKCRALNDEASKFCGQCGGQL